VEDVVIEKDWGAEAAQRTRVHEMATRIKELETTNEVLTKKCIELQKAVDAYAQRRGQTIQ
jgi:uncharacterized protein (DUF3084 family)